MSISHSQVEHFLATVKYMNMNKAAKELFISQPGLSLSISKLESELGVKLFYRDNNILILSEEGKSLLPYFKQITVDMEALINAANELVRSRDSCVNISFSGSIYFFSTFIISGCLHKHHDAIIKLCYVEPEQAVNMLLAEQIDFAISSTLIKHPRIATAVILTEPIGLVVQAGHPLAEQESITVGDLSKVKIHGLKAGYSFRQICDDIFMANNICVKYYSEEDYVFYHKRMKENDGTGVFLASQTTYDTTFKLFGEYRYLPINEVDMSQKISISYQVDGNRQFMYEGVFNYIKECILDINVSHNLMGNMLTNGSMLTNESLRHLL